MTKKVIKDNKVNQEPDSKSNSFDLRGTTQTIWPERRKEMPSFLIPQWGMAASPHGHTTEWTGLGYTIHLDFRVLLGQKRDRYVIPSTLSAVHWSGRHLSSVVEQSSHKCCTNHPLALAHCEGQEIHYCASGTSCCLSELSKVLS